VRKIFPPCYDKQVKMVGACFEGDWVRTYLAYEVEGNSTPR